MDIEERLTKAEHRLDEAEKRLLVENIRLAEENTDQFMKILALRVELDALNQGLPQLGKARTCGGCTWCDESGFCDNENTPVEWTEDYPDFYCGEWKSPEP